MGSKETERELKKIIFRGGSRDNQLAHFPKGTESILTPEGTEYVCTKKRIEDAVVFQLKGE